MEQKLVTFLNAFNINSTDNLDRLLIYINSNLRQLNQREQDITNTLISVAKPENLRRTQQLLLIISQYKMTKRANFLSVISRAKQNHSINLQIQKQQSYTAPNIPNLTFSSPKPSTQPQPPQNTLIPDLIYALNGISTDKLILEIDTATGLYTISQTLPPSISAFLPELGVISGLKIRLNQLLNSIKLSNSKPKLAFSSFCEAYLSGEFMQNLRHLATFNEFDEILIFTRENLRVSLAALAWAGELICSNQVRHSVDFLGVLDLVQTFGNGEKLIKGLKLEMEKPLLQFVVKWIQFGEIDDFQGDFFIEKSENSSWSEKFKLISNQSSLNCQILRIGKSVHFLRQICKILTFDMLNCVEFYQLNQKINDNLVDFDGLNLDAIEEYVQGYVNETLQNTLHINQYLKLVVHVFLGFQSDFITFFAEKMIQNSSSLSQIYKLSAVNQLDYIVQQSNLGIHFSEEVLNQIDVFIGGKNSTFSVILDCQNSLKIIFSQFKFEFKDAFDFVVLIRILELQLNQNEKNQRNKLCLFKIQNLVRFIACYVQSMYSMVIEEVQQNFNQKTNEIDTYSAFLNDFVNQIREIGLNGKLKEFINKIYLVSGQLFSGKISAIKNQQIAQIKQIEIEISKNIKQLIQELIQVKQGRFIEEYELLVSQLQLSGF